MTEQAGGPQRAGRARAIAAVRARMAEMDPPLSARDLAAQAKVNRETVNAFLAGQRWPQPAKRFAIERGLGWPAGRIEEIASGTPVGVGRSDDSALDGAAERQDLVRFLESAEREMTTAQRELLEAEVRAYALRRAMEIRGEL